MNKMLFAREVRQTSCAAGLPDFRRARFFNPDLELALSAARLQMTRTRCLAEMPFIRPSNENLSASNPLEKNPEVVANGTSQAKVEKKHKGGVF